MAHSHGNTAQRSRYRRSGADTSHMPLWATRLRPAGRAVQQSSRRLCHGPMCGGAHGSHRAPASSMADTILDQSRTIMTPLFLAYTSGKIRDYQPLPDAHTSAIRSSDSRYLVVRHPLLDTRSEQVLPPIPKHQYQYRRRLTFTAPNTGSETKALPPP